MANHLHALLNRQVPHPFLPPPCYGPAPPPPEVGTSATLLLPRSRLTAPCVTATCLPLPPPLLASFLLLLAVILLPILFRLLSRAPHPPPLSWQPLLD